MKRLSVLLLMLLFLHPHLPAMGEFINEEAIGRMQDPVPKKVRFDHNRVCTAGFPLKEFIDTNQWLMVTPIDLNQQGTERLQLVASNQYYFGYAYVQIQGDSLTIWTEYPEGNMEAEDEQIAVFTSLADITPAYLENPKGNVIPGLPLSIERNLGSAEAALILICSRVSYRQPFYGDRERLRRYWRNDEEWLAYRQKKYPFLEKCMAVD